MYLSQNIDNRHFSIKGTQNTIIIHTKIKYEYKYVNRVSTFICISQ